MQKYKHKGRIGRIYITEREDYTAVTKLSSVKLPVALLESLDELIQKGYFQNRSDAIREAVRRLIVSYKMLEREEAVPRWTGK